MLRPILIALILPALAACGNEITNRAVPGVERPLVAVLRAPTGETVLRGTVRSNPDRSVVFTATSTRGDACGGLFSAEGQGIIECANGPSVALRLPDAVRGEPSGTGVVQGGDTLIGLGWGDEASVTAVRAVF
jgi:hypothetical protein